MWKKVVKEKTQNEFITVTYSLQSILARSLLNAGRRIAGLVWHIALVLEYVPNAICDALVSREGKFHTIPLVHKVVVVVIVVVHAAGGAK